MDPRIRTLFKLLLYMGKEYPAESGGYTKFSRLLKQSFNQTAADTPEQLAAALKKGEYMIKGM